MAKHKICTVCLVVVTNEVTTIELHTEPSALRLSVGKLIAANSVKIDFPKQLRFDS
jgi:hypothetical protein